MHVPDDALHRGGRGEQFGLLRRNYAIALYKGDATLDDFREAVATLEDTTRTMRRVLGGSHPTTTETERELLIARAALARVESA